MAGRRRTIKFDESSTDDSQEQCADDTAPGARVWCCTNRNTQRRERCAGEANAKPEYLENSSKTILRMASAEPLSSLDRLGIVGLMLDQTTRCMGSVLGL